MSASLTDKITDVRNAARPNSARVSSSRSSGGTTLACDNLSGWPTASKVHFVTYQIDSNSNPVSGTQLDCVGIVSGSNVNSFTVIDGTDNGNSTGDVVEMLPTAAWGQDLADALMASHDRDGTLKAGAVDSSAVLGSQVVATANMGLNSVTPNILATGTGAAAVTTSETTTSTSFADLTTTTDTVTVTVGNNGVALVAIHAQMQNSGVNNTCAVGFAVSGATTAAASDPQAIIFEAYANNAFGQMGTVILVTGLAAGTTTFKMKYKVSGGTGTFSNRRIGVVPL